MRNVRSANASTVKSIPVEPVQQPSSASQALTDSLQPRGQKRGGEFEDERSQKRRRENSKPGVETQPYKRLNKKDLEELNRQTASGPSNGMGEKRSRSRRSSTTEMTQETTSISSQKSSFSNSDYRLISLKRVRIVVQHRGLPKTLQSRIDRFVQHETSAERKSDLFSTTDNLCNGFPNVLEVASREDDAVELILHALESINSEIFAFRRKAGIADASQTHAGIILLTLFKIGTRV